MPPKGDGRHQKRLRERFLTIAERRVNNVITELRRLGHCGNRMNYAYEVSEVDEMLKAIREAFDECREKFVQPPEPIAQERFKFKGKP